MSKKTKTTRDTQHSVTVAIRGTAPLLMHNIRLANPLDKYARELDRLNKEKKGAGADKYEFLELMARVEWEGGLYYDKDIGPYLEQRHILASLKEGARRTRGGKVVQRGVTVSGYRFPLQYNGPRDIEGMVEAGTFIDHRAVTVGRAKVMRARPVFTEWALKFPLIYDTDAISLDDLKRYLVDAGRFAGLGDGRAIGFGFYEVAEVA